MSLTRGQAVGDLIRRIGPMGAWFVVSDLSQGAIAFAGSLVVARVMGRDLFGAFVFWATIASTLTVALDLGFGVWLTRETARGDRSPGGLLCAAVAARLGLFVPIAVALIAFAAATRHGSTGALACAVWLAAAGLAYGCIGAMFRTKPDHVRTIVAVESGGAVVQLIGFVVIAASGGTVVELLAAAAAAETIQTAAAFACWRRMIGRGEPLRVPSTKELVGAAVEAWPFAVSGLIANGQTRVGPLLLGLLASDADVALFGAATRIGTLARVVPHAAFGAAFPMYARAQRSDSLDAVHASFGRLVDRFSIAVAVAIAAGSPLILRMTYGPQFSAAATTLVCVAIGLVPSLTNGARKVRLYATGSEVMAVTWSAVSLCVQTVLTVALVRELGATGAALGLVAGEVAAWFPLRRVDAQVRQRHQPAESPDGFGRTMAAYSRSKQPTV